MVADQAIARTSASSALSFGLFLVCSFVLLARPQDVLPFLQPWRPALVISAAAMASIVFGGGLRALLAALAIPETKRYLLFFGIMIFGIPFSYNRGTALQAVFTGYVMNVLFFIMAAVHLVSTRRLVSFFWVICLATLTYGVFGGLLQGDEGGRFEVVGNAFDPNDTAYVLVSLFPLCLYFVRFNEGFLKKLVALAAVFSAIAVIAETGSRGGMLALAVVLLMLLATKSGGIKARHKVLFLVILASVGLFMQDKIDVERYSTLLHLSSDYNVTGEEGRLSVWEAAIELALDNPITGVGVECFSFAWGITRQIAGDPNIQWKAVHNSWLQVAVEVGLIGFGVFLIINLRSALAFLRASRMPLQDRSREADQFKALAGLMLLGFSGLLVSGLFLSQGYSIFSTLYFALAAATRRIQMGEYSASPTEKGGELDGGVSLE